MYIAPTTSRSPSHESMERDVLREIHARFDPPRCHGTSGVRVAVRRIPGTGFGGDFHNVFLTPDGRFSFVLGTVYSGGLMAAFARAVLAGEATHLSSSPAAPKAIWSCFERSIDRINADVRNPVCCAVFHGELDRESGRFEYRAAGRFTPIVLSRRGHARELSCNVPALGEAIPPQPAAGVLNLADVSRLILLTDGLANAYVSDRRRLIDHFGADTLTGAAQLGPEEHADALVHRLREHGGPGRVFTEDVTIFIVDFTPHGRSPESEMAALLRRSRVAAFDRGVDSSVFIG